jgi:hypothetical protein
MDLPIFHNPSLALALMEAAGVADDDDETRAAEAQRFDAKAALLEARGKHAAPPGSGTRPRTSRCSRPA